MEVVNLLPRENDTPEARILACACPNGHEAEVLQYQDGSVAIRLDGAIPDSFRWPANQVDLCMRMYVGLLRHRTTN